MSASAYFTCVSLNMSSAQAAYLWAEAGPGLPGGHLGCKACAFSSGTAGAPASPQVIAANSCFQVSHFSDPQLAPLPSMTGTPSLEFSLPRSKLPPLWHQDR